MTGGSEHESSAEGAELPIADLTGLVYSDGTGAIWSLPHGGDLDANVVRVAAGGAIDEHVNDEVDVLIAVWSGTGDLTVDGESVPLQPGVVASIARGLPRAVYAGTGDLLYLSVHRRRGPMGIRSRRAGPEPGA